MEIGTSKLLPLAATALALAACARNEGEVRSYGNDALPSAEVTAFQAAHARLGWSGARIEYDAQGCAVYQGMGSDGRTHNEALIRANGQPICRGS